MQTLIPFTNPSKNSWEIRESAGYKLARKGTVAVSDMELLWTLIGSKETAKELLIHFGSLRNIANAGVREMAMVKGVGQAKALRIVAAFELARRKNVEDSEIIRITSSKVIATYLQEKYGDYTREVMIVLFLNRDNRLIAEEEVFSGGVSSVVVDAKIIFKKAVSYLASSVILAHNHPSGNTRPSREDALVTKKMVQAGDLLDICVLDHVIFTDNGYFSFADEGRLK